MALMSRGNAPQQPIDAESADSSYLPDSTSTAGDEDFYALTDWIESKYNKSDTWRQQDEDRWLKAYRNYRGLYGPDVRFTSEEKSQAFIKVTKTKVLAAYAQIVDVLFAGSKFPIAIETPNFPIGAEDSVYFDPKEVQAPKKSGRKSTIARPELNERLGVYRTTLERIEGDALKQGPGLTPTAFTFEPAKDTARRMEKMIHDQLDESNASTHLRNTVFDMALFGTGILKGPFAYDREYPKWDENGDYAPEFKTIPKIETVSIWNFYPDPDAKSMEEAEYVIERHRMSRSQMRGLKNRPFFREDAIENAIDKGVNYTQKYWEEALEDQQTTYQINRYEVLEYWGVMDKELAELADLDIPTEFRDKDQLQVNAWICNGEVLRLVLNPFTPSRIPYHAVPYEVNPYSFFGVGLAENMEDTQEIMNGFMRMAVDNAALSSNLLIEIDETNLVPGQSLDVYPGKVFRRQAGAPGQAIFGTKFPNVTNECLMMFDKARQLTDEATGMPSYAHGIGGVMGVGRTASGMSMLMGAAAQNIKAIVRNVDDYLLGPLAKALFAFNMQFNFDKEFTEGAFEISAKGTESLMRNEVRSQRLLQFMQMTANPLMTPFVKYDYILRELAASMDLDEDKILNDPREAAIQATMMANIVAMMPQQQPQQSQQPQQPAGGVQGGPMAPEAAVPPVPQEAGFTGGGGGSPQAAAANVQAAAAGPQGLPI